MSQGRLRIAVLGLAGCDGCEYSLIDEKFLKLLETIGAEIVYWPMVGKLKEGKYDIALVEGSVVSYRDLELLRKFRENSRVLIALGSCAVLGGVQAGSPVRGTNIRFVHGDSVPLDRYVRVDYYIRGCPPVIDEVIDLITKVAGGLWFKQGMPSISFVKRPLIRIEDEILSLDGSKCIVCGRCIDICSRVGAKVLNYIYRGIDSAISTPFQEPFRSSGCIYCGLCASYCPVGAISYRVDVDTVMDAIRNGSKIDIYVEPEALAALSESEDIEFRYVITALKLLGFSRVYLYSPLYSSTLKSPNYIIAASPAEALLLNKLNIRYIEPSLNIPQSSVYLTQCTAWKSVKGLSILTSREIQKFLRALDYSILEPGEPDGIYIGKVGLTTVIGLENLTRAVIDNVIFKVCPGGCLMGGGQPITLNNDLNAVLRKREEILRTIFNEYIAEHISN